MVHTEVSSVLVYDMQTGRSWQQWLWPKPLRTAPCRLTKTHSLRPRSAKTKIQVGFSKPRDLRLPQSRDFAFLGNPSARLSTSLYAAIGRESHALQQRTYPLSWGLLYVHGISARNGMCRRVWNQSSRFRQVASRQLAAASPAWHAVGIVRAKARRSTSFLCQCEKH